MNKRVCILSMQRVSNFGSLLQCYSLRKMLMGFGYKVYFIDIERNEEDDQLRENLHHDYSAESGYEEGLFHKIKVIDKYVLNRITIKQKQKKQEIYFEDFRKNELKISYKNNSAYYDCCVIGSDEVFNCMADSQWGFTSQLFGNVRQANKVITYAASCGATEVKQLPEKVKIRIQRAFEMISGFSVRDENTRNFITTLTCQEPLLHLDPVFVGNFEEEMQAATIPDSLTGKYCIVYSYYNRMKSQEEINVIRGFSKLHDLKLVTMGAPQFWIKDHVIGTPFQILKAFANADFVITDTFHGTIFSVKYANKFAVLLRDSNKNKLMDLVERLGIQRHLLKDTGELEMAYSLIKNEAKIKACMEKETKRTMDYLKEKIK